MSSESGTTEDSAHYGVPFIGMPRKAFTGGGYETSPVPSSAMTPSR